MTKSLSVSNGSPSLGHHHHQLGHHHHQLGQHQLGHQQLGQHGAATQLAHSEQQLGRGWAAAGQQPGYRHSMDLMVAGGGGGGGMSHSYTLPHSMSHHSSKGTLHTGPGVARTDDDDCVQVSAPRTSPARASR